MPDRREFLTGIAGLGGGLLAGCLSGPTDDRSTPTGACSVSAPPNPGDAAADPKPYPGEPAELTAETVKDFVAAYERAYRYNDALAANPELIGRTNEITVTVDSVAIEATDGGYTARVEGVFESDFIHRDSTVTPETPTATPLPAGHGPFEATYTVSSRSVKRAGVVVECW